MHTNIEVQHKIGTWHRQVALQYAQYATVGVAFHVLVTHLAVQNILVIFFHAHLTHVESAAIIGLIQYQGLALIDTADIAQGMGEQLTVGVVTQ